MEEGGLFRATCALMSAHALGKAFGDLVPVDDIPPGRQILWAPVLILQIVGMLPDIVAHYGVETVDEWAVLVGRRGDRELAIRADDQPRPAGAEAFGARVIERRLELIE